MSRNCLLTPNGFCQWDIPLEHLFFSVFQVLSFFFFFIWIFSCSGAEAEYESITSSTQQLVWKWAILFCSENNSTFSRQKKGGKKLLSLIVSGENIIRERKACYWMHYHIHNRAGGGKQCRRHVYNVLLSSHQPKTRCLLPADITSKWAADVRVKRTLHILTSSFEIQADKPKIKWLFRVVG